MTNSLKNALKGFFFPLALFLLCGSLPAFDVDFNNEQGPMKRLGGVNLWADAPNTEEAVRALTIPCVRLHAFRDGDPKYQAIDLDKIFPVLTADPTKPENYHFSDADSLIRPIAEQNIPILYRLGITAPNGDTVLMDDPEQFAAISIGIIRHYTEGWANGYQWNIPYWEIGHEPDLVEGLWKDPNSTLYVDFYLKAARLIKESCPTIQIGGPALSTLDEPRQRSLFRRCKKENVPIDFLSWHIYTRNPDLLFGQIWSVRYDLDAIGLNKTKIFIDEWHYLPPNYQEDSLHPENLPALEEGSRGLNGIDSAAFIGYVTAFWERIEVEMGNIRDLESEHWGLVDPEGNPRTVYYAFQLIAQFVDNAPVRVATVDRIYTTVTAGIGKDGKKAILVSNWLQNYPTMNIRLIGAPESGTVTVRRIDSTTQGIEEEKVAYTNGTITLKNRPGSFLLLITF